MANSKVYDNTGSGHDSASEFLALRPAFSGLKDATVSDASATDLNTQELQTRLDVIRGLYLSETSQDSRKQYRNEARRIKQAISRNSRKMSYLAGSLVLAIVLLMFFLQNIGLIL